MQQTTVIEWVIIYFDALHTKPFQTKIVKGTIVQKNVFYSVDIV